MSHQIVLLSTPKRRRKAEHDKEVGNSHLVSAGVVVTVVSVVEVSVLHPAKTISSYSRL